jgi:hypothetical protein
MQKALILVATLLVACSTSSPASSESGSKRPRRGHGPEDVPSTEAGARALPKGHPVAMPRDGMPGDDVHGGGGGMPGDDVHGGGGGMPGDDVHGGGGMPGDDVHGGAPAPAGLEWTVPQGWRSVAPSSSMRVAEWSLGKADGDQEDASAVVFHFPGMGGGVQANLDRWYTQFEQPDGRPTSEVARVSSRTVADLRVTITDVSGTFSGGGMMGGAPSTPQPNFRMVAAIVETDAGPWFFKLTGPGRTVERWRASFDQFVVSLHR